MFETYKTEHIVTNLTRYESNDFYNQTTQEGHSMMCGNQSASEPSAFEAAVQGLLADLQTATPRIDGYFAATKKEVVGGGTGISATVYGVAQCIETITESGCRECMQVVTSDIQRCPPNTNGRAVDVGCFLRYSDSPFFADNQTIDIRPFLRSGESLCSSIVCLIDIFIACFLFLLTKANQRDNM